MSKVQPDNTLQAIISHAKEYGFVFPSSEIYDGLSAVYDYGPYGAQLKKNIRDYWWNSMTQLNENIVGIDAAIFMHPTTWKASGHVDFTVRQIGAATVASIASGGLFAYTKDSGLNFEGVNFSIVNNLDFDTTVSNTLVITAEWNTNNAGNSIYSEIFTLNKTY